MEDSIIENVVLENKVTTQNDISDISDASKYENGRSLHLVPKLLSEFEKEFLKK